MTLLTLPHVEYLAFKLAREHLTFNEPIPDFSTRFPNSLESCLAVPFQTFGGRSLYPTLLTKAAVLFYLMIKNHPFQNGNKQIAMTTLTTFLFLNGKWLVMDTMELYNLTMWVAQSPPAAKRQTAEAVEAILRKNLITLPLEREKSR